MPPGRGQKTERGSIMTKDEREHFMDMLDCYAKESKVIEEEDRMTANRDLASVYPDAKVEDVGLKG